MSSFINICEHGGHWCRRCSSYVTVAQSDQGRPAACEKCGSISLRFDPAVEGFHAGESFKTDPKELAE